MPRNQPVKIRGAGGAPAAAVSIEDVKRAYYENAFTPATSWITEMQLDPPQLIVCDDATSNQYRVPLTINGSTVTFGSPVEVQRVFTDAPAPAKTAASRGPGRGNEAIIAAAVSAGRIPSSRAQFYRDLAKTGTDISHLDTLATVPGVGHVAASAAQDAEDAAYCTLFGGTPGSGLRAVSAAQPSEDDVYQAMYGAPDPEPEPAGYSSVFPGLEQARAAFDARAAAKAKVVAAMTDDELWHELGFDRRSGK
jgi:hypothetical protein